MSVFGFDTLTYVYNRAKSIHPYCKEVKRGELWTDCTDNRHSVALCNLVEYQAPLPLEYQVCWSIMYIFFFFTLLTYFEEK